MALAGPGCPGPTPELVRRFEPETDTRSNVKAGHGVDTTNLPGVFAAGDMRRGQSLVVRTPTWSCSSYQI